MRKQRRNVSQEKLQFIEQLLLQGKTPKEIADLTQLSLCCVYKRLQTLTEGGQKITKKPGSKSINQTNRISIVSEIVQSDNTLNLAGISESLEAKGILLKRFAVGKLLKKVDITRKRLKFVTTNALSPCVIEKRAEYSRIFSRYADEQLIFLDGLG